MLNFKKYPNITEVIVDNRVKLSNNNLYNIFFNMQNL